MVSLNDDLTALKAARPRTFEQWLDVAEETDRAMVLDAIAVVTIPANALAVTLTKHGIPITRETILRRRSDTE
jgi:hypothetical protein